MEIEEEVDIVKEAKEKKNTCACGDAENYLVDHRGHEERGMGVTVTLRICSASTRNLCSIKALRPHPCLSAKFKHTDSKISVAER